MKNIAIVLSGGVGKRFGGKIPKQYFLIDKKPCIDYVISEAKKAKTIDEIVVVMDKKYKIFSKELQGEKISIVPNGNTRYYSLKNAFDEINKKYECKNIIIVQAVSPLITSELIDTYIQLLKDNDCVITARKLTGELGATNDIYKVFDRDQYFLMESPEAFNFKKIYEVFDPEFRSSELAYQLPNGSKNIFILIFLKISKLLFRTN